MASALALVSRASWRTSATSGLTSASARRRGRRAWAVPDRRRPVQDLAVRGWTPRRRRCPPARACPTPAAREVERGRGAEAADADDEDRARPSAGAGPPTPTWGSVSVPGDSAAAQRGELRGKRCRARLGNLTACCGPGMDAGRRSGRPAQGHTVAALRPDELADLGLLVEQVAEVDPAERLVDAAAAAAATPGGPRSPRRCAHRPSATRWHSQFTSNVPCSGGVEDALHRDLLGPPREQVAARAHRAPTPTSPARRSRSRICST